MTLFVDTSVWSLAWRRDHDKMPLVVEKLRDALGAGMLIVTTGLVVQELLQGFHGPKQRTRVIDGLSALPLLVPDRDDHIAAAELRNHCRRKGVQVATIDALFAQLCIRHDLQMLSADRDFSHIARHTALRLA